MLLAQPALLRGCALGSIRFLLAASLKVQTQSTCAAHVPVVGAALFSALAKLGLGDDRVSPRSNANPLAVDADQVLNALYVVARRLHSSRCAASKFSASQPDKCQWQTPKPGWPVLQAARTPLPMLIEVRVLPVAGPPKCGRWRCPASSRAASHTQPDSRGGRSEAFRQWRPQPHHHDILNSQGAAGCRRTSCTAPQ